MKLSTEVLKDYLTGLGYSGIKRISKKNMIDKKVIRVFSTDTGNIEVISNCGDLVILTVDGKVCSNTPTPKNKSSLKPIKEITKDKVDFSDFYECNRTEWDNWCEMKTFIESDQIEKYFIFADVDTKQYGHDYTNLIVKTKEGELFLLDLHYFNVVSLDECGTVEKDLVGLHIGCDFNCEEKKEHIKIYIPSGSRVLELSPEYTRRYYFNEDFTECIATVGFGAEPCVEDTDSDDFFEYIEGWVDATELDSIYSYFKKFDFNSSHM